MADPASRTARSGLGWNAKSSWLLDRYGMKKRVHKPIKWSSLKSRMTVTIPGCHKWLRKWSPGINRAKNGSLSEPALPVLVRSTTPAPPKPPRLNPSPSGEDYPPPIYSNYL